MKHFNFLPVKKVIIIGIIMFYEAIQLIAQTDSLIRKTQFLLPEFVLSVIKLKTGEIVTSLMNYNTITQKMTFLQEGTLRDLNKPEAVDTVSLQNKKFIPYHDVFLEVLLNARVSLFIQHISYLRSNGRPGAYGIASHTLGPTSVSKLYTENKGYDLKVPENYSVVQSPFYWISVNNVLHRVGTGKQILKLFQKNNDEIKLFFSNSNINIKKEEDLLKLVNYCNDLIRE